MTAGGNWNLVVSTPTGERQAALYVLRRFSDRELKDIGLCRGDLGDGLAEAAKYRLQSWRSRGTG